MGLIDAIFRPNKEEENLIIANDIDFSRRINTLLLILENLNSLNAKVIDSVGKKTERTYDRSLLPALKIDVNQEEVEEFRKFFELDTIGFGKQRINEVRAVLEELTQEAVNQGKNENQITEELLNYTKQLIGEYETIIRKFNETLKRINSDTTQKEEDKKTLIDYLVTKLKEEELGYPIDLEEKVEMYADSLKSYEFGGYGTSEIRKFKETCYRKIDEGKKNNKRDREILAEIENEIFVPLVNKYKINLEVAKKSIEELEKQGLEEKETSRTKKRIVNNFKENNGHGIDLDIRIEDMKIALSKLPKYGYGEFKLEEFERKVKKLIERSEKIAKTQDEILNELEQEFNYYKRKYEECLLTLEQYIIKVRKKDISDEEKDKLINREIIAFKDEMGHPINIEDRINRMIEELTQMGYGPYKIEEFKRRCDEIRANNKIHSAGILRDVKDIDVVFSVLKREIEESKNRLNITKERINNNDTLSEEEKKKSIDEFELSFEIDTGHYIDITTKLEEYKGMLKSLPGGGYGDLAIEEFETSCMKDKDTQVSEKAFYQMVKTKALILRNRYLSNREIFASWKEQRLAEYKGKNIKEYERELDKKIRYMLSLSPDALEEYYREDDKKQRKVMEDHNTVAEVIYLAKEEAKVHNNPKIYDKRMKELDSKIIPYSDLELKRAKKALERIGIFGSDEDLEQEEMLMDASEYIDNTLYRQLAHVTPARIRK